MKTFLTSVVIIFFSVSCLGQIKYWEDFSKSQKTGVIEVCKSDLIKKFYEEKFVLTDDDKTERLLKELTTSNDTILPLSFFLLNKICLKSDGALSEIMGCYCIEIFARHPNYVLTYFSKERALNVKAPVLKTYAEFAGYELYFKKENTSDLKYTYEDCKAILSSAAKNNKENEKTFVIFWHIVDDTIKDMNDMDEDIKKMDEKSLR